MKKNVFLSDMYNVFPILGKSSVHVPTDVSAWTLKIPPSQKNRYLGTCVLPSIIISHVFPFSNNIN